MSKTVGLTTKGELKEQYSCKVDISRRISISSSGNFVLFSAEVVSNQQNFYDYKGRIVKLAFGYHGEEYFEFSYFGDYITSICYKFETLSPEYFSLSYENGKIYRASGPYGEFKIIYDSWGDVSRGEKI